jgi:hypothetical protein
MTFTLSSKFIRANKKNGECEVCGDDSGKCRRKDKLHLCMTFCDAKFGAIQNGLKCVKPDIRSKGWATFVLDYSSSSTRREQEAWRLQALWRRQRQKEEQARRKQKSLSPVDRDRFYRRILAELELHPTDRADLLRRGFSNHEIKEIGFKSVDRYQWLHSSYPESLPGIKQGGKQLLTSEAGYLCPIFDEAGRILAFQLRVRELSKGDKNRYRWLTAPNSENQILHLFPSSEGELPLTVVRPGNKENAQGVALTEGVGAKPHLVTRRLNYTCIGAAGGLWCSSPTLFAEKLSLLAAPGSTITIFPDAGDVLNRAVIHRWKAVVEFLKELGYECCFAWWQQTTKHHKDADELSLSEQQVIKFLSPAEFFSIHYEQMGKGWQSWRASRAFTDALEQHQQYFSAPVPATQEAIFIRSGLGTGKTHWLIETLICSYKEKGFLSIGYRNSLLLQFCEHPRFKEEKITWYHLQSDLREDRNTKLLLQDRNSNIACCIDSLPYFHPEDFEGRIVILDEVESVVKQLLQADTAVSFRREQIKELFFEMLSRAEIVVCLDGLLSDQTVQYLQQALNNKKIIKYANTYSGNRGTINFLEMSTREGKTLVTDYSSVLEAIYSNTSRFTLLSDSQQQCEAIGRNLLEQGRKVLRVDSTTVGEPDVRRFLRNPSLFLRENNIEVLIYSPSAEAGLNIDIKDFFSDIYALFLGVVHTNAQLQMLARVRDPNATIHLYCAIKGIGSDSVSKSTIPNDLQKEILEYVEECAYSSLTGFSEEVAARELASRLIKLSASAHFGQETYLAARSNHERIHLRDCLREALLESGYTVEMAKGISSKKENKTHKETIKAVQEKKAQNIFLAPDISTEEANKKSRSFNFTPTDKASVARRRILDRLPGIEHKTYPQAPLSPTLLPKRNDDDEAEARAAKPSDQAEPIFSPAFIHKIKFENRAAIAQAETLWFLMHPEAAKTFQQAKWYKHLTFFTDPETPDGSKLLSLLTYRSRWLQISTLRESGILELLSPDREWSSTDPALLSFYQFCKSRRVQRALGLRLGDSTPCEYLGRVLRTLGLKTVSRFDRTGGEKRWFYKLDPDTLSCPIRQAILKAVEERFTTRLQEMEALDWQTLLEPVESAGTEPGSRVFERSPSGNTVYIHAEGDPVPVPSTAPSTQVSTWREVEELIACVDFAVEEGAESLSSLLRTWQLSLKSQVIGAIKRTAPELFHHLANILWSTEDGNLFL